MIEFLTALLGRLSPATETPKPIAVPDDRQAFVIKQGYTLTELPKPRNVRPVRRHEIEDIGSLAEFLNRHFDPETSEILAAPGRISAVSGAAWTRDVVVCGMAPDPSFVAWCKVFGAELDQRAAFKALNARREEVVEGSGIVAAFRTLEVHHKAETKLNLTGSGAVEFVSSVAGHSVTGKIPDTFTVRVPVYRGGPAVDIEVIVEPDLDAPVTFTFTARNLDKVRETAFEAEVATLRAALNPGFLVTRGSAKIEE